MSIPKGDNNIPDNFAEQLNRSFGRSRPWGNYAWVKVLTLYWDVSQDGYSGFQEEARMVAELFRNVFTYQIEEFSIPLTCSTRRLRQCLLTVLNEAEDLCTDGQGPCLLIIYYGGHGDQDDEHHQGQERRAVWAASAAGDSPMVEWYSIQEELKDISTDVLLLLDCCFAAQAARDRKNARGRIELLAAAAMGIKTRLPGPSSFTTALIRTIKSHTDGRGHAIVASVAADLAHRDLNLQTPVHLALRTGSRNSSIRLEPLSTGDRHKLIADTSNSSLRLLIKASAELNLEDVVQWLRSDLPHEVFSIQAEEIFHTTSVIQDMMNKKSDNIGEDKGSLPIMEAYDVTHGAATIWSNLPELLRDFSSERLKLDKDTSAESHHEQATTFLTKLRTINGTFIDRLEQQILQALQLNKVEKLQDLLVEDHLRILGIADHLHLHQIISGEGAEPDIEMAQPPDEVNTAVKLRTKAETKEYGRYLSPVDISTVETRLQMLVDLLNAPKSSEFRSLRCIRWFHQRHACRFVLEFEVPTKYLRSNDEYSSNTLSGAIRQLKTRDRPSLGQRFSIARTLARAVRKWHTVGWVHQSISSANVCFFYTAGNRIDFNEPFLQGFDFARPSTAPSINTFMENVDYNVYRHPDRQGLARQGHKKIHDIFSLGVVLLEIGLWEVASVTVGAKSGQNVSVNAIQTKLIDAAKFRLAHHAGKDYQEATLTCLEGDFNVYMDDAAETQLAKAFQHRVIDKLSRLSGVR